MKGVKNNKIRKKIFFDPPPTNLSICAIGQNNPPMQLLFIFHKTNQKSENVKALLDLAVFQQLRKLWKGGEDQFVLFLHPIIY